MRVGIYNRWLATLGGGERYSLAIAAYLARRHSVEVISHTPMTAAAAAARLHLDLAGVHFVTQPERPPHELAALSVPYDLFINASNNDFIPAASPRSAMIVYFPLPLGRTAPIRRWLGTLLRRQARLPDFRCGIFGEMTEGGRTLRSLAPQAEIVWPSTRRSHTVRFELRSDSRADLTAQISLDGRPQTVVRLSADGRWTACAVAVPAGGTGGRRIGIALLDPPPGEAPAALSRLASDHPAYRLYTRTIGAYAPELDLRLHNLPPQQPSAILDTYGALWAISAFTQQWIERSWQRPSTLLYPPVDVAAFAPRTKRRQILSVGRFFAGQHSKKHLLMIDAFRALIAGGLTGWELHLAGSVNPGRAHEEYLTAVRRSAEGCPVTLHTDVDFAGLAQLYGESAIYWHAAGHGEDEERTPIRLEHFGITTVEAMAAGCVPVVIGKGGQRELVEHGHSGFLWYTSSELQAYTQRLCADEPLRRSLGEAAQASSRRFDHAHFEARLAAVLAELGI